MARPRRSHKNTGKQKIASGLSPNPATNLLMADVAIRTGTYLARYLAGRQYNAGQASGASATGKAKSRSLGQTVTSLAAAKIATSSVPGALVVGTGLFAKMLFDRSQKVRRARREAGKAALPQPNADD